MSFLSTVSPFPFLHSQDPERSFQITGGLAGVLGVPHPVETGIASMMETAGVP
jgi:hypothetical protein